MVTGLLGLLFRDKMFMIENVHSEMKLRLQLTKSWYRFIYSFSFFCSLSWRTRRSCTRSARERTLNNITNPVLIHCNHDLINNLSKKYNDDWFRYRAYSCKRSVCRACGNNSAGKPRFLYMDLIEPTTQDLLSQRRTVEMKRDWNHLPTLLDERFLMGYLTLIPICIS
jgi:hypothetical protein